MKATTPRDLTPEEKARPYAKLFYREPAPISERTRQVLDSGKMMDPKYAILPGELREKLTNIPEEAECGYCYLPGGGAYATGRHDMPGITEAMYRHWLYWWNGENPDEANTRYKIWNPQAHHNSGFMWSNENIGDYLVDFFITEPLADHPEKLGLTEEDFREAGILMMDGANARQKYLNEDIEQQPIPSIVVHVLYDAPDGIIMRSHFWIGFQAMGGQLINVCGDKKLVDENFLRGLVEHNSSEMNGLAQIMPILYTEFRRIE